MLLDLALVLLQPGLSVAQVPSAAPQICEEQASNARTIAKDRDAGVSKADELKQAERLADKSTTELQVYAQAALYRFVERLYGPYARVPPDKVYASYLNFCLRQAAQAQVP